MTTAQIIILSGFTLLFTLGLIIISKDKTNGNYASIGYLLAIVCFAFIMLITVLLLTLENPTQNNKCPKYQRVEEPLYRLK